MAGTHFDLGRFNRRSCELEATLRYLDSGANVVRM
jgi:hypothetical protein